MKTFKNFNETDVAVAHEPERLGVQFTADKRKKLLMFQTEEDGEMWVCIFPVNKRNACRVELAEPVSLLSITRMYPNHDLKTAMLLFADLFINIYLDMRNLKSLR